MRALRKLAARLLVATLLWSSTAAASGTGTGIEDVPTFAVDAGANNPSIGNFQTFTGANGIVTTGTLSSGLPVITFSLPTISINSGAFAVNSSGNLTKINNVTYSWPAVQGGANTLLQNDGAGNLSWVTTATAGLVTGTGVATRVAFWSSTTALSSNASLFWDNGNARLGIGTSSPGTDLDISRSASGGTVALTLANTSNTASSFANETISVAGGSAEDPTLTFTIVGATTYTMGLDNSAADHFKLSASSALGTTDVFDIVSGGASVFNTNGGTFDFSRDDATTNAAINILRITKTTSGTAANNIGAGLLFRAENAAGSTVSSGQIQSQLTNATAGAETTNLTFATGNAGGALATQVTIAGTGAITAVGPSLTLGTAGTATTTTLGQGTTGTDASDLRVRSGNSGATAASIYLARNTTDFMRLYYDGSNTNLDFTTALRFQGAVGGSNVATLSSVGDLTISGNLAANGASHTFGTNGTSTDVTVGEGGAGTDTAMLRIKSGNSGTTAPTLFLSRNITNVFQLTYNGTDTFIDYAATGALRFRFGINGTEAVRFGATGKVSIGSSSLASLFNVGSLNQFQVDSTGDIVSLHGVPTSFPSANSAGVLTNNGLGTYSITANGATGGGLPSGTTSQTLRHNGTTWVANSVLQNNGTNVTDTGNFTAQGATHTFGTASIATTMTVGQGTTADATTAILRIRAGDAGTPQLFLTKNTVDKAQIYVTGNNLELDTVGQLVFGFGVGSPVAHATLLPFGKLTLYSFSSADKTNASLTFVSGGLTLITGDTLKNGILHVLNGGSDSNQATGVVLSAENVTRDYAQFYTDTMDTYIDFSGNMNFRAGMNGPIVAQIDPTGNLALMGNNHRFGVAGVATTVSIGNGSVGTTEAAVLKMASGAIPGEPHIELNRAGTMMGRWGTNGPFLTTAFDYNTILTIRDINLSNQVAAIFSTTAANFGTAGSNMTLTAGQGTTGTDVGTIAARSGNSGTTGPVIKLSRNATDLSQWTTDGTNTFLDYTGILTFRSGIAGTVRAQLDATGELSLVGTTAPTAALHILTNGTIGHIRMGGIAGNPASPTAGDIWYNTTQASMRHATLAGTEGFVGLITAITGDSTPVTANNTETAFSNGNTTFASNTVTVGKTIRIHAGGTLTSAATPGVLTIRARWGNVNTDPIVCGATTRVAVTASMTRRWSFDCDFTFRTVGGAGSVGSRTIMGIGANATAGDDIVTSYVGNQTLGAPVTNSSKVLTLYALWSNASNSITLQVYTVETLD